MEYERDLNPQFFLSLDELCQGLEVVCKWAQGVFVSYEIEPYTKRLYEMRDGTGILTVQGIMSNYQRSSEGTLVLGRYNHPGTIASLQAGQNELYCR